MAATRGSCSASSLNLVSERDPAPREVVGGYFDGDPVTLQHANAEAAHVAAERREHGVSVRQRHPKRGVREYFAHGSFELIASSLAIQFL